MKFKLILIMLLTGCTSLGSQTLLLNDDFESYSQGQLSSQNSGWTDLSNATANIAWNGGLFSSCSNNDVNQAYLSFISGDNIAIEVGLNAVNGQVEVEMNVSMVSGFEIKFFSTDIFYEDHFIDVQEDLNLKYIINFETNFVYRYINGNLENSSPIQANFNSLENIAFSNSFGNFKLGCISVSDVTDLDNDGYYANEDCDDTNPQTNPGAAEIPYDGLDNDCNPNTPDDDLDGDGYVMAIDCNDNNASINPGVAEIAYNGLDDDCNAATPDDDLDGDGYVIANDCNDNNAGINPGITEIVYNGIDDDCNPTTLDDDLDRDGFSKANDCNDNNPAVNPGVLEIVYNGIDDDCNPSTLDDDLDKDGFNKENDCDDNNDAINPGSAEIAYNGIDDDCNPNTPDDDLDGDGFIEANDCDDFNSNVNPGVSEIPGNGIDDNCNGLVDEITATTELSNLTVIISPNPAKDFLYVQSKHGIDRIEMYNSNGIKMGTYHKQMIDVSHSPSGVYFLLIYKGSREAIVRKFVIER